MAKRRSHGLKGLGALGRAGAGSKPRARISKGVRKTVAAFVIGRAKNNCAPRKGGGRNCTAVSTGSKLEIQGQRVAERTGTSVTFCPADFPRTPEGREAASTLLRALRTGLHVSKAIDGEDGVYSGRGARTGVKMGADCTTIPMTKEMIATAAKGAEANTKAAAARIARAEAAAYKEVPAWEEEFSKRKKWIAAQAAGETVASGAMDGIRRKRRRRR